MNKLKPEKQKRIIASLIEGNSIRATCRMTDTAKGTVLKLLADVGKGCAEYQDKVLRDLPCKKIQCDEIWSFCYAKEKNVPEDRKGYFGFGDVWTFTAIQSINESTNMLSVMVNHSQSRPVRITFPPIS